MRAHCLGVKYLELMDADVRLHILLRSLASDSEFGPRLAFKGGTWLIKCFLTYPRFSTDLDFTWVQSHPVGSGRQGSEASRKSDENAWPHAGIFPKVDTIHLLS